VIPAQSATEPWNPSLMLAGLLGLAVFSLIAGLIVARRGVPGALAS
jgi:hypothetical protein